MSNEIATLLKSQQLKTHYPLALPTLDDVVEVQEAILISLPARFRNYLLECSDAIFGRLEPVTLADPNSHTYLPEVAALAWSSGMPREFIPLCQDGTAYYCVDQQDVVFLWHREGEEPQRVCDDVWEWVRDIWLNLN